VGRQGWESRSPLTGVTEDWTRRRSDFFGGADRGQAPPKNHVIHCSLATVGAVESPAGDVALAGGETRADRAAATAGKRRGAARVATARELRGAHRANRGDEPDADLAGAAITVRRAVGPRRDDAGAAPGPALGGERLVRRAGQRLSVLGHVGVEAAADRAARHAGLVGLLGGRKGGLRAQANGGDDVPATVVVARERAVGGRRAVLRERARKSRRARRRIDRAGGVGSGGSSAAGGGGGVSSAGSVGHAGVGDSTHAADAR